MALPVGTGSIRSAHEAPDGSSPSVTIPNAVLLALHQYRNDILYPPAIDSRARRIDMIDALLRSIEP